MCFRLNRIHHKQNTRLSKKLSLRKKLIKYHLVNIKKIMSNVQNKTEYLTACPAYFSFISSVSTLFVDDVAEDELLSTHLLPEGHTTLPLNAQAQSPSYMHSDT
ncbi:hypothetical protein CHARACLAT_032763 [Characodon lateralis]|uniref:Uncharacterized protein n=1 Tax=Characodon lateralis TaxID=208331 RepID=A0ABU7EPE1_9TELE|nr:hypothetical protein [Characodon lateralis]